MKLLIKRLETEEPTRELADKVLLACGWTRAEETSQEHFGQVIYWHAPGDKVATWSGSLPNPLISLDAALELVPEGMEWDLSTMYGIARATVGLNAENEGGPWYGESRFAGGTPIALTIAALKARND